MAVPSPCLAPFEQKDRRLAGADLGDTMAVSKTSPVIHERLYIGKNRLRKDGGCHIAYVVTCLMAVLGLAIPLAYGWKIAVYLAPVIYQCLKLLNKVKIHSIFAALCHPCPQKPLHYKAVPNCLQVQVFFEGRCAKAC